MECKNVGTTDQLIRVAIALVLLVLGISVLSAYSVILFILAMILALTSLIQFCPLYKVLGINTCEYKKAKSVEEAKEKMVEGQTTKAKKVVEKEEYKKEPTKAKKVKKSAKKKAKTKRTTKKKSTKKVKRGKKKK